MDAGWEQSLQAFEDAARWFVRTTSSIVGGWDRPGLGEWDLRALVGHTSRALLTVEAYVERPAPAVEVDSCVEYFRATSRMAAGPEVAARGRDAGAALGADPATAVVRIADRVLALVRAQDGTAVVTTVAGGMRLSDYLPTRTFELAVHTCDVAVATGQSLDVPPTAADQALGIVAELSASRGVAGRLLLAATGRPVPPGTSVL
jgi:hypothetical protein